MRKVFIFVLINTVSFSLKGSTSHCRISSPPALPKHHHFWQSLTTAERDTPDKNTIETLISQSNCEHLMLTQSKWNSVLISHLKGTISTNEVLYSSPEGRILLRSEAAVSRNVDINTLSYCTYIYEIYIYSYINMNIFMKHIYLYLYSVCVKVTFVKIIGFITVKANLNMQQ